MRLSLLAQVTANASLDQDEFDPRVGSDSAPLCFSNELERLLRPSQGSFTVRHHGEVLIVPCHPTNCSVSLERLGIVAGSVGGLCGCFPDYRQSRTAASRGLGVTVSQFRIGFNQLPGCHQMGTHKVGGLL